MLTHYSNARLGFDVAFGPHQSALVWFVGGDQCSILALFERFELRVSIFGTRQRKKVCPSHPKSYKPPNHRYSEIANHTAPHRKKQSET